MEDSQVTIEQLEKDLALAAKAQDSIRLTVLRLLKSALKNQQIEVGHDLSTSEILSVLQKEAKKRQDSIDQYLSASRQDLVDEEKAELEILEEYLPAKMNDADLEVLVKSCIKNLNASGMADMGKVIAAVMSEANGAADGAKVAGVVKNQLS